MFILTSTGEKFETLMDIARALGKPRVKRQDFDKLGIKEVEDKKVEDKKVETQAEVDKEITEAVSKTTTDPEPAPVSPKKKPASDKGEVVKKFSDEAIKNAEKLQKESGFTDIFEWAVAMKKMTAAEVTELAEGLGLTWTRHENARINRMRAVQEMRKALFLGEKRPRVRRSEWNGIDYDELKAIAKENNVSYRGTADDKGGKINRMWIIKALKEAGITPPTKVNV